MNYTYIVKCSDDSLYTGWTNDIEKRLAAHNSGKGAKYTSSRGPVELVYLEEHDSKQEAMQREYGIKQLTRKQKLEMIEHYRTKMSDSLTAGEMAEAEKGQLTAGEMAGAEMEQKRKAVQITGNGSEILPEQVTELVEYLRETYSVDPEHPWAQYPEYMTFKDKWCDKWFALIMKVTAGKLNLKGYDPEEILWVVNVKADPDFIGMVTRTEGYLPGYHMNKQHWLTVLLDGSVPIEQVYDCVDTSFLMITDTPTRRIYEAVKKIPRGRVATYGQVAELAGDKKMARAVGNALHKNPDPEGIPCFRVVNAKGELAGEFAFGGAGEQAKRLIADGTEVVNGKVDLEKFGIIVSEVADLAENV